MNLLCHTVALPDTCQKVGTGWLPPLPDMRDYTPAHEKVVDMEVKLGMPKGIPKKEKKAEKPVDLRVWCSPVEDQGNLGSCTAHAAMGIVEYFEKRAFGRHLDGSRLFVYKTTRNLMEVTGDTGAWLRNTMGALVLCGVPPERYWEYTDQDPAFDKEPSSFVYAVADDYSAVSYVRHDAAGSGVTPAGTLASVKSHLDAGIPSMFGFWGFPSFMQTDVPGDIPYPCSDEYAEWGHAIAAVGYDNKRKIKNNRCGETTEGALLIRNSWGTGWGDLGYGWLPYEYVLQGLALDFWSLLSMKWIETGEFGLE